MGEGKYANKIFGTSHDRVPEIHKVVRLMRLIDKEKKLEICSIKKNYNRLR
jgi:hypothetical protein